jgi:hypothetical protein
MLRGEKYNFYIFLDIVSMQMSKNETKKNSFSFDRFLPFLSYFCVVNLINIVFTLIDRVSLIVDGEIWSKFYDVKLCKDNRKTTNVPSIQSIKMEWKS